MAKKKEPSNQAETGRKFGLDRTILAIPLLEELKRIENDTKNNAEQAISVIIDTNLNHPLGLAKARDNIFRLISDVTEGKLQLKRDAKNQFTTQFVFAELTPEQISAILSEDNPSGPRTTKPRRSRAVRTIYKIWLDHEISTRTNKSCATIKADAACTAFGAGGKGVVWAVIDSGVDQGHPHFEHHKNLEIRAPLRHCDFTQEGEFRAKELSNGALTDGFGHGTHVAGIIAGEVDCALNVGGAETIAIHHIVHRLEGSGDSICQLAPDPPQRMCGMAPRTKIVSLKVLGSNGKGSTSSAIAALAMIDEINQHGRFLLIHGVNLSLGYDFNPEWFACGQSPLCVQVNRLVSSGVVVVTAAGNAGFGYKDAAGSAPSKGGQSITINDPGNADLAITVGSTHRDMPHTYGVSYFSSKGPTGDGRLKPDLVAPGEKILSCASAEAVKKVQTTVNGSIADGDAVYIEDSGTSMAAPHVSGAIAAFLSIRSEFKGNPLKVKEIFMRSATDLGRERYFQGSGLLDLMRAIQSV